MNMTVEAVSNLMTKLEAKNLSFAHLTVNPDEKTMRELASKDETTTEFGSPSYVTEYRSRSAAFTRNTVEQTITAEDLQKIEEAKAFLKKTRIIQLDRYLGEGEKTFHCRLFVSERYARLALMFHKSLSEFKSIPENPDFITVDLPEFPGERRILVDTHAGVTYVLGSDYYGEIKKSFLRQFMFSCKQAGGLGLHAGSKEVWAKSQKTGKIQRKGLLFFGLSGTGKTSLTCHEYELDAAAGEYIRVRQDDVVAIDKKSFCLGSEPKGFYIKTEGLDPSDQKALYQAATSSQAVFENVFVSPDGKVDFDNTELTGNGRAVVNRREVMFTDEEINMPSTDAVFFITRNPLVPPLARLTPGQGVIAFMLGESIKTSAADPNAKGEPVREVGTNPFIVGDRGEEGNILRQIFENNPSMEIYLLNTGHLGVAKDKKRKIGILETVAMIRAVCRESIDWIKDEQLNLQVPQSVDGVDSALVRLSNFFEKDELASHLDQLRKERRNWLAQFSSLHADIADFLY